MALASFMAQAAGAATSAAGAYSSAVGQKNALMSSAAAARLNAQQLEENSLRSMRRGEADMTAISLRGAGVRSQQRAGYAAGNIDLTQGSAQAAIASTDVMTEIDRNQAYSNAISEAFGYRTEAVEQMGKANVDRATAKSISPGMAAATSLLGSAASLADKWYTGEKTGAFKDSKARWKKMGDNAKFMVSNKKYLTMPSIVI
jgi:hypothetical protein